MDVTRKTYVFFEFSPVFISESRQNEDFSFDDRGKPVFKPGTFDALLKQYQEVRVPGERSLKKLKVPKGTLRFYFYDRMTATTVADGKSVEMRSEEVSLSGWYYLENEGELITREGLMRGEGFPPDYPDMREALLEQMHDNKCDHIFQVGGEHDYYLKLKDMLIKPGQVQMIDTEFPWPS